MQKVKTCPICGGQFVVTKIYKHFFEAVRIDRGWERSFTKADYITGEVRRKAGK